MKCSCNNKNKDHNKELILVTNGKHIEIRIYSNNSNSNIIVDKKKFLREIIDVI